MFNENAHLTPDENNPFGALSATPGCYITYVTLFRIAPFIFMEVENNETFLLTSGISSIWFYKIHQNRQTLRGAVLLFLPQMFLEERYDPLEELLCLDEFWPLGIPMSSAFDNPKLFFSG